MAILNQPIVHRRFSESREVGKNSTGRTKGAVLGLSNECMAQGNSGYFGWNQGFISGMKWSLSIAKSDS